MAEGGPHAPPDRRRTRWVRLADVPRHERLAAYRRWARSHPDDKDAAAMFLLALNPGDAGGWICP